MFCWSKLVPVSGASALALTMVWVTLLGAGTSSVLLLGCGSGTSMSVPAQTPSPSDPATPGTSVNVSVIGPANTRLGATAQFNATVTGTSNAAVTWMVNGTAGGSAADGTISAAGLYSPPSTLPSGNTVAISAISQASSNSVGTLNEAIWNPVPAISGASARQTATNTATLLIDVQGSSFVPGAEVQVGGVSMPSTYVSATDLKATVPVPAGATSVAVSVINPDPGSAASTVANVSFQLASVSVAAAARLLDQSTFGPKMADIQHVQQVGMDAYLTEQFATAPSLLTQIANPTPSTCPNNPAACMQGEWWQTALTGPDQLRQRVAFALSPDVCCVFTVSERLRLRSVSQPAAAGRIRQLLYLDEGCHTVPRHGRIPRCAEQQQAG